MALDADGALPGLLPVKLCGGKTRAGGKCARPSGWGTPHPGNGRCKFHGGASPSGIKAARKEAALEFGRGMLGALVVGSPLDGMQEAVEASRGVLAYWRAEIADAYLSSVVDGTPEEKAAAEASARVRLREIHPLYMDAIKLEKDCSQAAVVAGVAERRQRLAERQADVFAAAITDGLREAFGDLATPERRAVFSQVVRSRLLALAEQESPALPAAA